MLKLIFNLALLKSYFVPDFAFFSNSEKSISSCILGIEANKSIMNYIPKHLPHIKKQSGKFFILIIVKSITTYLPSYQIPFNFLLSAP